MHGLFCCQFTGILVAVGKMIIHMGELLKRDGSVIAFPNVAVTQ